jgi:Zn-dependent alcohol dehydrogenase
MQPANDSGGRNAWAGTASGTALFAALGLMLAATAAAHHSISGVYDNGHRLTFAAQITEFQFVNPHPYIVVAAAPDATGTAQHYRLEMDNRHELVAIGITATTLAPGDAVVVTGSVSRTEPQNLYLWRLERAADGLLYEQIGTRPRISHQLRR